MLSELSATTQPALSRVSEIQTMAVHAVVPGGMRLLLVHAQPEPELARTLAQEGHDVLAVAEDERPARFLGVTKPEVVLVVAPDAAEICRHLRRHAPDVAIIAILPSRNVDQVIAALEAGADDCLGRPFHRAELIARVIAAWRRGAVAPARPLLADRPTLDGAA
jgi:two-component system, OmpR family, response regulator